MKIARSSWAALVLSVCCISILGYALLLQHELAELKDGIAQAQRQQSATRLREKTQGPQTYAKSQSNDGNRAIEKKAPLVLDASVTAEQRENMLRIQEEELRNRNRMLVQKKNYQKTIQRGYGYILEALAPLDPSMNAKLKDIMVDRELIMADIRKQASIRGIAMDSPEYEQLKSQMLAGPNADIASVLGDKAAAFFDLDRIYGAVSLIDLGMKYNFAFADVPIDRETTVKLAKVMTDLNYGMNNPKYPVLIREPVNPETGLTPLFAQLLSRSGEFLSPKQLEVLRAYQDEVLANINQ
ncbi:MAG: hypothetical protein RL324_2427 [Verrucomicrobiota bacterium]|jgi:hypothetical protein